MAHAKLSPSGSKRWFACPGSTVLEAPFPDTSNTYSDSGTAMHEVAAWCLTEHRRALTRVGNMVPVNDEGEPDRFVEFTEDMAELVQGYVDFVRREGINHRVLVEKRVEFSDFVGIADQFGTADAIIVNEEDGLLSVIDLKTGYRPVDVVENSQLMLYALGAVSLILSTQAGAARDLGHAEVLPAADSGEDRSPESAQEEQYDDLC